jgi:dihydrofolate synthase/folylpolyglutamate synthase
MPSPFERHLLQLPIAGAHQIGNAALAVTAAWEALYHSPYHADTYDVVDGLKATRINARLETVQQSPRVILDGAHNPVEAKATVQAVRDHWLQPPASSLQSPASRTSHSTLPRLHLVVGILADKDQRAMVREFASIADSVVVTQPPLAERMLAGFRAHLADDAVTYEPSPGRALDIALERAWGDDIVLVTGSMFLAGALRERCVPEQQILERRSSALIPPSVTSV